MKDEAKEGAARQSKTRVIPIVMAFREGIYRMKDGEMIVGTSLLAFIHNMQFHVTEIKIYKDGLIDCWELVDFEQFKKKVRSGWVKTTPVEGARIGMGLGNLFFTATNVNSDVEPEEFIKEVEDELRKLNKRQTSRDICIATLKTYQDNPTSEHKEDLRLAYEDVPKHLRKFLGDMDSKDWEYKEILKGD